MTEQQRLRSAGRSRGNPTARGAIRSTERQRRGLAIPPDEVVHPAPGSIRKPAALAASASLMAVGVVLALALAPGWDLIGLALMLLSWSWLFAEAALGTRVRVTKRQPGGAYLSGGPSVPQKNPWGFS